MNTQKLISGIAFLVSIGTLMVFIYQTNLIRKQQYMSVYPYLEMGNYNTNSTNYRYVLENNGIGPAIIKHVEVQKGAGKIYTDFIDYLTATIQPEDSINFFYASIYPGRLIPANEEINVFGVRKNCTAKGITNLQNILNHEELRIEIEYESIYQERWKVNNRNSIPQKLE